MSNKPPIGAHISTAGSLDLSFDRAKEMGAEVTQIFISSPRQWHYKKYSDEEIEKYKQASKKTGIGPNFIHGSYLINLGTQNPTNLQKAVEWLIYALNMADELRITGVIFHPGSHGELEFDKVLPQITKAITQILKKAPQKPYLILETSAGQGGSIGDSFSELGKILKGVNDKRVRVCLDTCHVFSSNYNVKTQEGLKLTLDEFDKELGLDNLVAIHANDSKFEIGSKRDRHANIGEGFIGKDGFKNLLNNPKLKDVPFILEVPGFADNGPDAENVKILKSLRS